VLEKIAELSPLEGSRAKLACFLLIFSEHHMILYKAFAACVAAHILHVLALGQRDQECYMWGLG
jgi:hypothetical protein